MNLLPVIILACLLVSCARTPKAVIITPKVKIDRIQTEGVDGGIKSARVAITDVSEAIKVAISTIDKLSAENEKLKMQVSKQDAQIDLDTERDAVMDEAAIEGQESRDKLITAKADLAVIALRKHRGKLIILVIILVTWIFRKALLRLVKFFITGSPI